MNICTACGKGTLSPVIRSSPILVLKEMVTQNELEFQTVFVQNGKNKNGYEEHTATYYLAKEMAMVGLQLNSFSLANFYMHVPHAGGRKKVDRELAQACLDFSISEVVKIAKDMKLILMMGAETVRIFTGYNATEVYGLTVHSDYFPTPVIIPAPNSDKLLRIPIGEMRNALGVFADQVKTYKQYIKIGEEK